MYVVANIQSSSLHVLVIKRFRWSNGGNSIVAETLDDYSRISIDVASVVGVLDTQVNRTIDTAQRW
ncbi:hypothetical protein PanWU01x14_170390 [Parasponia andersonii]|uniref:Uncharacterized protein n=1 Tax=Parasponia andersonii TaxID=3476 RepID=A0A2P5CA66_PARAD|nr:hypothetical protein PanWU01x14_170390 [Parasponia andersonii]